MLIHIHIRDFAIIEYLDLDLQSGMNVLTGETGAGKSILVDALGLVLGDRADSGVIRHKANKAEITVSIDLQALAEVRQWLTEQDLLSDDECVLRRVIVRDGRSKAYVNGSPVALSVLKSLGSMLVDIHGQHEHQSLLRRDMQRRLLDAHAANEQTLHELGELCRQWRMLNSQLESLNAKAEEREARIELLRYQTRELSELGLESDEIAALEEEQQRLANVERLRQISHSTYLDLYENDDFALYSRLGPHVNALEELATLDPSLGEWHELLVNTQVQLAEVAKGLRRYANSLDADPERLEWVEQRISQIHDLARKHRVNAAELPLRLRALESELKALQTPERDPEKLRERLHELENEYHRLALLVRRSREAAAKTLSEKTTTAMQELGMSGGKFRIDVTPTEATQPSPAGLDSIEFLVSANPGQPVQALSQVASGGELSRISLAIQMVAAKNLHIPTLIFDEVDSGIGGAVAESVGRQLRRLGENRQVLCVTHLPQVAAQAHHHYVVKKVRDHSHTTTHITSLNDKQRISEIARMLGGLELTEQTLVHAEEMITLARRDL